MSQLIIIGGVEWEGSGTGVGDKGVEWEGGGVECTLVKINEVTNNNMIIN